MAIQVDQAALTPQVPAFQTGDQTDSAQRVLAALANERTDWNDPRLIEDVRKLQLQLKVPASGTLDETTVRALLQLIMAAVGASGGEGAGYDTADVFDALRGRPGGGSLGGGGANTGGGGRAGGGGSGVVPAGQTAPRTPGQPVRGAAPGTANANIKLTAQSDGDNCGKAAIAMALSAFSGKHESDTQWGGRAINLVGTLKSEVSKFGGSVREVPFNRQDFTQIDQALAKGFPVVIGSGFGSPSGFGHFVTLAGMRGEGANKEYLVADPNGGKQYWAKQSDIRRAPPHSVANCNVAMITDKASTPGQK